nr:unnamed protein product [Digitaria exilis]
MNCVCVCAGMAKIGEREWYFFVPRDRKAGSGGRPNRTTERGFWKATGSDRAIRSSADAKRVIGLKKTLVFYQGRAPRGTKTDWVMNEYRLPDYATARGAPPPTKEDMVLCKIYRKATPLKELEQRASAMEEMQRRGNAHYAAAGAPMAQAVPSAVDEYLSPEDAQDSFMFPSSSSSAPSGDSYTAPMEAKQEAVDATTVTVASSSSSLMQAANMTIMPPPAVRHGELPTLQVPMNHGALDWWMQDLSQLRSPWQDQLFLSPLVQANLLY